MTVQATNRINNDHAAINRQQGRSTNDRKANDVATTSLGGLPPRHPVIRHTEHIDLNAIDVSTPKAFRTIKPRKKQSTVFTFAANPKSSHHDHYNGCNPHINGYFPDWVRDTTVNSPLGAAPRTLRPQLAAWINIEDFAQVMGYKPSLQALINYNKNVPLDAPLSEDEGLIFIRNHPKTDALLKEAINRKINRDISTFITREDFEQVMGIPQCSVVELFNCNRMRPSKAFLTIKDFEQVTGYKPSLQALINCNKNVPLRNPISADEALLVIRNHPETDALLKDAINRKLDRDVRTFITKAEFEQVMGISHCSVKELFNCNNMRMSTARLTDEEIRTVKSFCCKALEIPEDQFIFRDDFTKLFGMGDLRSLWNFNMCLPQNTEINWDQVDKMFGKKMAYRDLLGWALHKPVGSPVTKDELDWALGRPPTCFELINCGLGKPLNAPLSQEELAVHFARPEAPSLYEIFWWFLGDAEAENQPHDDKFITYDLFEKCMGRKPSTWLEVWNIHLRKDPNAPFSQEDSDKYFNKTETTSFYEICNVLLGRFDILEEVKEHELELLLGRMPTLKELVNCNTEAPNLDQDITREQFEEYFDHDFSQQDLEVINKGIYLSQFVNQPNA